jgi:hypothetical protein
MGYKDDLVSALEDVVAPSADDVDRRGTWVFRHECG